MINKNLVEG